jgi:hypothetical protein
MESITLNSQEAPAMQIVRTPQSWQLIEDALTVNEGENLVNASFMLSPKQIEMIRQLARENRYLSSQGAVLRYIIDEWMRNQLEGRESGQ